jgi:hypothetical protein
VIYAKGHDSGLSEELGEQGLGMGIQNLLKEVDLYHAKLLDMDIFTVRTNLAAMDEVTIHSGHV